MTGGQSTQTQTSAENNIAHTIPREIFLEILKFACAAFASAQLHPTDRRVPHLDVPTALRLCLISRDSYATLAPLIYRHVHLTRPSKIEAFNETLKGQPALRKHVRTAWFGADAPCSPNPDFPLQDDGMTASILTSEELPRDISIGTIWHRDFTDRRYSMVLDALDEASCHVGIDATGASLKQHHWRTADEMSVLPYDEYLCRIYEVQAALDLYLRCLREYEDAQIAKEPTYRLDAGRPGFPRFVMLVPGKAVTQGGEIDYLCSMKMIYHHLATSKVFDQVEHPLLLARFKALKSYSKGYYSSNRPTGGSLAYPSRNKFLSREESRIARDAYKDGRPSPYPFMLLKHPMTFHTLACLTQDVVYKLPKLESLALSASLERSFIRRPAETSGLPAMFEKAFGRPSLPSISHLSVGPPSSIKFTPYLLPFLETSSMSTLRSIDIIDILLWREEAEALAGKDGLLPQLQFLRWTMWAPYRNIVPPSPDLFETVRSLAGGKRSDFKIFLELHPYDVRRWRSEAPSDLVCLEEEGVVHVSLSHHWNLGLDQIDAEGSIRFLSLRPLPRAIGYAEMMRRWITQIGSPS